MDVDDGMMAASLGRCRVHSFLRLSRPNVVAYSPTGELAIVDEEKGGKLYLLSQYVYEARPILPALLFLFLPFSLWL